MLAWPAKGRLVKRAKACFPPAASRAFRALHDGQVVALRFTKPRAESELSGDTYLCGLGRLLRGGPDEMPVRRGS